MSKYAQAIEFWSDIRNVENASPEDIQSDILAYLNWLVSAEKKLKQVREENERLQAENQKLSKELDEVWEQAMTWKEESGN